MLQLKGIQKRLGSFVLKDISFELPEGYICGLIGQNGAGKTSILRMILGLYQPEAGELFICGKQYTEDERGIKNSIGYVMAEELFSAELTLLQNAQMYGKYYENYEEEIFKQYCSRFSLEENRKLKKLSKGEKLKFQFAFALAHRPKLLILDEPTANFDPGFREEMLHILTDFIKDGKHSVLLVTHLMSDVERIADYVTFIHKGQVVLSMDKESLCRKYRLVCGEAYQIAHLPKEKIVYEEKGNYGCKALVRHGKWNTYDAELSVNIPTVEEIMYYIVKGGGHA